MAKGQFILHLISQNRKSYDIHVLCYEYLVSKYQNLFPSLPNIQYHDCMTNNLSLNQSMYETVTNIIKKSIKNVVILIDSLSMYLLRTEFSEVYKEILDITSDKGKLKFNFEYNSKSYPPLGYAPDLDSFQYYDKFFYNKIILCSCIMLLYSFMFLII